MKSKKLCNVLTLVLMAAMVSSCEKMVPTDGAKSETLQNGNVIIHVSQFEQKPFESRSRGEASDYCTRLCFHIYDEGGTRVKYVNQKQEDAGFGSASFTLDEGRYVLVVVGHNASANPSFSANEKVSISGKNLGDTFWCCEELEVKSDGLEKSLELKRIVSLVRFIPTDENPATLDQMVIKYKGSRGTFNGLTGYGSTDVNQTVDMEVSPDDTQFEFYMIPSALENTLSAEISTYSHSATGSVIPLTQKTIDQIPVKRNCVTICRGNLFDGKSSERSVFITVSIDGEWDEDINLTF